MAKMYDISMKITNELPVLKITEDIVATVNNRKKTILNVMAMVNETEKKKKDVSANEQNTEEDFNMMQKALEMLIGEKHVKELEEMNLPVDEYSEVFSAVMQVAQGKEPGEENTP